jgi:hypothetical protein
MVNSDRDFPGRMNTCRCLTLILACIIDRQAREIGRVVCECAPEAAGIDLTLLDHVSRIEWDNVLLYGQYVINPSLIRTSRRVFSQRSAWHPSYRANRVLGRIFKTEFLHCAASTYRTAPRFAKLFH